MDFNGWFRSLTNEQRAILVRGLSKNEAELFLRNMSKKERLDLFSAFPEGSQLDRLMEIVRFAGVAFCFRRGADFLEERLGPAASGSAKWAGATDKELEDEDYDHDPPK